MISIIIVCEYIKDRDTIIKHLSPQHDFQITAQGKDGYDALQLIKTLKPNVLIMEMNLPGVDAIEFAPVLKRHSADTALMILSSLTVSVDQNRHAGRAIKAGVAAYLLKQEDMNKLAACVRLVHNGGCYVSAPIMKQVFSTASLCRDTITCLPKSNLTFSSTERRIIALLLKGRSDIEMAENLHLARGTIRNCLSSIKRKIGAKNRIQIIIYALSHDLGL